MTVGFGINFFKKAWDLTKEDLYNMFLDFHAENLDIKRMNYEIMSLVPKVKDANNIRQFRPV